MSDKDDRANRAVAGLTRRRSGFTESTPALVIQRVWAYATDPPGRIHYLIEGRHLYCDPGSALHKVLSKHV